MNLPNQLTMARCVLTVFFVVFMSFDHTGSYALAYALFAAAAITDYYDGKIARERNLISNFGKLMDPVADKVLMVAAFVMMMRMPELHLPGWTVVAILGREFLITGARSLAAAEGLVLPANAYGKAKTVIQMVFVFVFLALAILHRLVFGAEHLAWLQFCSMWGIIAVSVYTVWSGAQFGWANWTALKLHDAG